tara:strand:- start:4000 stop:6231 length:2232 start_codon:yes stop_codon:yes gene_type:complete
MANPFDLDKDVDQNNLSGVGSGQGIASLGPAEAYTDSLREFLGMRDYATREKEATDLAKMQLGLALAQRGFGAMGAQPQYGESPIGVLGRTLGAPLAGDVSTIAGKLMQQRNAARLAEQQLKLAALKQLKDTDSSYFKPVQTDVFLTRRGVKVLGADPSMAGAKVTVDTIASQPNKTDVQGRPLSPIVSVHVGGKIVPVNPAQADDGALWVREDPKIEQSWMATKDIHDEDGEVLWVAGNILKANALEFQNLPRGMRNLFSKEDKQQARTLRDRGFQSLAMVQADLNPYIKRSKLTFHELDALHSIFPPESKRAIPHNIRDIIHEFLLYGSGDGKLPVEKSKAPDISGDAGEAAREAVGEAEAEAVTYEQTVQKMLQKGEERYKKYSAVLPASWDALSFAKKMAFSRMPRVQTHKLPEAWKKAQQEMIDEKNTFKTFSLEDRNKYNAALRLYQTGKYMKENRVLEQSGVYTGWLGPIKNYFLSPWQSEGSKDVQFQQIVNNMRTHLTELETTNKDSPSVFSAKIRQKILPSFYRSELMNEKNLTAILSELEDLIKTPFSESFANEYIVPKEFELSAKEAGLGDVSLDRSRYWWADPTAPPEFNVVTKRDVWKGLGEIELDYGTLEALVPNGLVPTTQENPTVSHRKVADNAVIPDAEGKFNFRVHATSLSSARGDPNRQGLLTRELEYNPETGERNYTVLRPIDPKSGEPLKDKKGQLAPWTIYTKQHGLTHHWVITVPGVHH